jgi:hypothetical protein
MRPNPNIPTFDSNNESEVHPQAQNRFPICHSPFFATSTSSLILLIVFNVKVTANSATVSSKTPGVYPTRMFLSEHSLRSMWL